MKLGTREDREMFCYYQLNDGATYLIDQAKKLDDVFCGCGNPTSAWNWIAEYLNHVIVEGFYRETSHAEMICLYLMDHLGFTGHGATVNGSWITDDGIILFGFICRWGIEWFEKSWWVDIEGTTHHMLIEDPMRDFVLYESPFNTVGDPIGILSFPELEKEKKSIKRLNEVLKSDFWKGRKE